jgi:transposase
VLPWLSQSASLNPIEHVWKYLKVQIEQRPTSIYDFWKVVLEEWEEIPLHFIDSLYSSMPKRAEAVLKVKRGNTRYYCCSWRLVQKISQCIVRIFCNHFSIVNGSKAMRAIGDYL